MQAQGRGSEIHPVEVVVAEIVELLVLAVFAINDECLVRRNLELPTQILEESRHFGFKASSKKLSSYILEFIVASRQEIECSLSVAGFDVGKAVDLHRPHFRSRP